MSPETETRPRNARNARNGKSSSDTSSGRLGLVHGVTKDNWPLIARQFIGANGGFLLGLADGECQGVSFQQAPRQWGAWRAYFKKKGIPTAFMDAKAKATAESKAMANPHCWTVPAEWPHLFDAEATVQDDHEAGNHFMRNWRPPNPVMADAAQRAITAAGARKAVDAPHNGPATFKPFPALWAAFADEAHILNGKRFEVLSEASRRLAVDGKEAARVALLTRAHTQHRDTLPDQPAKPDLKYNNYDELLANYEKDMAAHKGRA